MSNVYNEGKELIGALGLGALLDMKALLVADTYTFNPDHDLTTIEASEISGTGYARPALTGESMDFHLSSATPPDIPNSATYSANSVSFGTIVAGIDIRACVIFNGSGGAGSLQDVPLCQILPTGGDITTDGSELTFTFNGSSPGEILLIRDSSS